MPAPSEPKCKSCPKTSKHDKSSQKPSTSDKYCPKNDTNTQQKPFTLDHFKMIVNALKRLGVDEKEIITYIKDGKKLDDILKAKHINPNKFKRCIIKEYCKVINEAQKNNQITCQQSKQLKATIKETIKNWLPSKS